MRINIRLWAAYMVGPRPGWYPFHNVNTPPQEDSWRELSWTGKWPLDCDLQHWDGSKWENRWFPSRDVQALGACPACGRFTALLYLTKNELKPYKRAAILQGIGLAFKPHNLISGIQASGDYLWPVKCVDCACHVVLCKRCRQYNMAILGSNKCRNCGMKVS
jgi:hypothetical protein